MYFDKGETMSFGDAFDGYCVIHAPLIVPERRTWFEREFDRVGVTNYTVIEAKKVDGSDPRIKNYRVDYGADLLSLIDAQKSCIDLARKRGWKSVAILEDDVIFKDNFEPLWEEVEADVTRSDWGMLNPYRQRGKAIHESPHEKTKLIPIVFNRATHCVIIRSHAYPRFLSSLKHCEEKGFPADFIYEYFVEHCNGKLVATNKNLVGQKNSFKSTLKNTSFWSNPFGLDIHYACFNSTRSLLDRILVSLIPYVKKLIRSIKRVFK